MNTIKFTTSYNLKDLYEAQKLAFYLTKPRKIILLLCGIIVLLPPVSHFLKHKPLNLEDFLFIGLAIIFIFYSKITLWVLSYFIYRKNIKYYSRPVQLEFDEDGIRSVSETANTAVKWSNFYKFAVNKEMLLLYTTSQIFNMLPKRAFKSDEEWKKLIELVKQKIKNDK